MKSIKSVKIIHQSMGLHCSYDITKHKINIHKTGFVKHSLYNGVNNRPVHVFKYKVDRYLMTEFFNFLEPITTTWESDYSVEVLDGWEWEFNIKYYDGTTKKVIGTVEQPPNGEEIVKRIKALAKYDINPLIF